MIVEFISKLSSNPTITVCNILQYCKFANEVISKIKKKKNSNFLNFTFYYYFNNIQTLHFQITFSLCILQFAFLDYILCNAFLSYIFKFSIKSCIFIIAFWACFFKMRSQNVKKTWSKLHSENAISKCKLSHFQFCV
jgi:hypothetical protein